MLKSEEIKNIAKELGADTVGIAKNASIEPAKNRFLDWLDRGYAGEMHYLSKCQKERFNLNELLPGVQSIVSVGLNYCPSENDLSQKEQPYQVAKFAWGKDYHIIIRKILEKLRKRLKEKNPQLAGRICVDTAPFMDIFWAEKAGLGWQGKHANLVSNQYGCWMNIGALILNEPVDKYNNPHSNHCGTCSACIDACPTGALVEPYILDSVKCLSYWTIESKAEKFPDEIRENLNNWVFGCDICIDACPFNRFSKPGSNNEVGHSDGIRLVESGDVINLSEEKFNDIFDKSPILRPGLAGLQRNIKSADN